MGGQDLYDEDILLWSEQQADIIRRLRRAPGSVPNGLDIENVAEEIESVGRSELAAVESYIELILVHLMKLVAEPDADATRHWRSEIAAFHSHARRRYAPSMRQRIDLDGLWRSSREQVLLAYEGEGRAALAGLPAASVFDLDDLLAERIDSLGLAERLRNSTGG